MKCKRCNGNGRIELLEHCPDCKHDGKCDGEVRCVCGCTEGDHECRSVVYYTACVKHACTNFRPVLPWPDETGWWWCSHGANGNAWELLWAELSIDGEMGITNRGIDGYLHREVLRPARFTRLLENNPFTSHPTEEAQHE